MKTSSSLPSNETSLTQTDSPFTRKRKRSAHSKAPHEGTAEAAISSTAESSSACSNFRSHVAIRRAQTITLCPVTSPLLGSPASALRNELRYFALRLHSVGSPGTKPGTALSSLNALGSHVHAGNYITCCSHFLCLFLSAACLIGLPPPVLHRSLWEKQAIQSLLGSQLLRIFAANCKARPGNKATVVHVARHQSEEPPALQLLDGVLPVRLSFMPEPGTVL